MEILNDASEEKQLIAIKKHEFYIQNIKNPSEKLCLASIKKDARSIHYINDPSEKVCLAAVRQNGYNIEYIDNPSIDVQKLAIQKGYIDNILILSKEIQEWFINQNPVNILKIPKGKLDPELAIKYNHLINMSRAGILN